MPKPIAYKTGTIQPPNTAKQNNILVGVGPSNWGAGAANATFYNSLDSSYQYVIVKNSAVPAMWGTGDFTTGSLLTTINGLPERVGQTRFTDANTAISWSLASGGYTILKNESPYGGPITNGLILDFNPKVNNYFANGDFAYGTTIGWVDYGGAPFIYDITNDKPYVGSKTTKALANTGGGFTWGRYTSPIYGPAGLLVVGQTYTFSFWAKLISGPSFGLSWNNQNGSGDTSNWTSDQSYTLTNTWQKITRTFTYNISKNYLYFAGNYAANSQYIITELQLEDGSTANAFSSFPVTAAGLTIPNNGLINSSSFSLNNGPYLVAENQGVIKFDGVDDYVDSGYDLSWNNTNSVSVEFWINPSTVSGGNYGIMGKMYPDWEWAFYQYNSSLTLVYWNTGGGHSNGMDFSVNAFPTANTWYHVVYTWDGSTSIFYVNGVALGSKVATDPSINQNRSNNVMLGGHTYVWADSYWNGKLGNVRFYNRKLSAGEVDNLYDVGAPTYFPTSSIVNQGLTVYYDFSNPNCYPGSGTTAYDLSGYGYNGTLTNGVLYDTTSGGALIFDGVDDYVNFASDYYGPNIQTVCIWGIADNGATSGLQALVANSVVGDASLRFHGGTFRAVAPNAPDSNDYQLNNVNKLMINGTSSLSTDGNGFYVVPNGRTLTQNFYVGAIGNMNLSTLSHIFNGRVYKGKMFRVALYNRQLTNAELQQNFNAFKAQYGF